MSAEPTSEFGHGEGAGTARRSRDDLMVQAIVAAAIILFVAVGGSVVPQIVKAWQGLESGPEVLMANALVLNVALILMGWNRYKALQAELAQRCASEEEAHRLARTDPLTGCLNRRSFIPAIDGLIANAIEADRHVAVGMIDLDNFKNINDYHGHQLGDAVLLQVSRRFRDLLPTDALLARLGGDEFALALSYQLGGHQEIEALLDRIVAAAARPVESGDSSLHVTASIGVASTKVAPPELGGEKPGEQLMNRADIAMYQAKKLGRNRVQWFEPAMEYEQRFRGELESGIRRGIAAGQFIPYYEQQIDLEDGKLTGFEMLARWNSPELGIVSPDIFIPIVEEMGLIEELSRSLMIQAFDDARKWHPSLTLAVNVSPLQLRDPWFSQKILKLLLVNNFPPSRLEVEITESAMHEQVSMVRNTLTSLRNQGVMVTLDDFGMGYSSLSQLRMLPFDRLKIDRTFVKDLKHDSTSKLVGAIISMGEGLDMPLVAEGIEDGAILEQLKAMGKLKGQGYHYGRPEPADKVLERLAELGLLAEDPAATSDTGEASDTEREAQQRAG